MTQPKDLPTFATDPTWTSGPDTGLPVRTLPTAPDAAQGAIPGAPFFANNYNAHIGLLLDHVRALAAGPVLNWDTGWTYRTNSNDGGVAAVLARDFVGTAPVVAVTLDFDFIPHILTQDAGDLSTLRSRDGKHWLRGGTAANAHIALGGHPVYDVAIGLAATGDTDYTNDAGLTWNVGTAMPTANNWQAIMLDAHGDRAVAFGQGKGATTTITAGIPGTWVALTLPGVWAGQDARAVFTTSATDSITGYLVCAQNPEDWVLHSADGTTWTEVTLPLFTQCVGGCWSESHQRWFVLGAVGVIMQSDTTDPNDGFTAVATLATDLADVAYHGIAAFGRYLVVFGRNISTVGGAWGGSMVVTDLESFHTLSVDQAPWDTAFSGSDTDNVATLHHRRALMFEGRLMLARVRKVYDDSDSLDLAFTQRGSWDTPA